MSGIKLAKMKFQSMMNARKYAIEIADKKIIAAAHKTIQILRIIVFLHSAKDFPSVLRLYEVDPSPSSDKEMQRGELYE